VCHAVARTTTRSRSHRRSRDHAGGCRHKRRSSGCAARVARALRETARRIEEIASEKERRREGLRDEAARGPVMVTRTTSKTFKRRSSPATSPSRSTELTYPGQLAVRRARVRATEYAVMHVGVTFHRHLWSCAPCRCLDASRKDDLDGKTSPCRDLIDARAMLVGPLKFASELRGDFQQAG